MDTHIFLGIIIMTVVLATVAFLLFRALFSRMDRSPETPVRQAFHKAVPAVKTLNTPDYLVIFTGEIFRPREGHRTGVKKDHGNMTYVVGTNVNTHGKKLHWYSDSITDRQGCVDGAEFIDKSVIVNIVTAHRTMDKRLKELRAYKNEIRDKALIDDEVVTMFLSRAENAWEEMNFYIRMGMEDIWKAKEEKEEAADLDNVKRAHEITADTFQRLVNEQN